MKVRFKLRIIHWASTIGCLLVVALVSAVIHSDAKPALKKEVPPAVEVAPVEQKEIPIYDEWVGALDGLVNAAVKAQVTGYILRQTYKEGSFVKKGQLLFEIDPRPFQAALDRAEGKLAEAKARLVQDEAQLAAAEADQVKSQLDVDRYTPLAKAEAASQQDLDNAIQTNLANKARVEAARASIQSAKAQIETANAAVETARINLGFTKLTSPIDGIAGRAQMQIGDLVSPSSPPVTTVSTVNPIKVYFAVSEQEYLEFNHQFPTETSREAERRRLPLELVLADGTTFPYKGSFYFADRQIDESTGTIEIAGLFPNPGNVLRPGGYAKVRAAIAIRRNALIVPQRAVTELQGSYQVAVVDSNDKVSIRTVKVGERVGNLWIITEGLRLGERVVAEGFQKVRPGMQVEPKPFVELAANRHLN